MNINDMVVMSIDIDPELSTRFASVLKCNPDVEEVIGAFVEDAVKFMLGDMTRLDAENAAQHFIASVQDLQVPCDECRGWGVFQLSPSAPRCVCEECSGRGWKWRNGNGTEK